MKVVTKNGDIFEVPSAVEGEEIGPTKHSRLVLKDSSGDPVMFFVVENVVGYGREVEKIEFNQN